MLGLVKYVWRCSKQLAYIEMHESDMARIESEEFAKKKLLDEVDQKLGGANHTHNFELTESFENINVVLFDCQKGKYL